MLSIGIEIENIGYEAFYEGYLAFYTGEYSNGIIWDVFLILLIVEISGCLCTKIHIQIEISHRKRKYE